MSNNEHHVLHYAKEWSLRKEAKVIRDHMSLRPRLDTEVHSELHRVCPPVPLLGYHALMRVASDWHPHRDTLKSMDDLLLAIDQASRHPKSHRIDTALAQLTMQAIDIQRPFIRQGLLPL